jgi:hypothetical protein
MKYRRMIAPLHQRAIGVPVFFAALACGPYSARAAEPGRTPPAATTEPSRPPEVDALCPWGRLSDGRGRLIRCLTRDEASRLREPAAEAPKGEEAPAAPPPAADEREPARPPEGAPPAPVAPPVVQAAPEPAPLDVEIGPIVADSGTLPDGQKSFSKARDRFVACVAKNGGLTADRATVELRFLVQGLGRAEGVSVKKHRGMSEAAAKCIGSVVDRRYVGYPDEPAVGATVVVTLSKKKR